MAITPTISSVGIAAGASGLDVNAIIDKLMAAEAVPLNTFDKKTASYQAKLSALGTLSGSVSSFQSSLSALTNSNNFRAVSATPSDPLVLSASAGAKAVAGSYNINVSQLAQAQTLTSGGMASKLSTIGSGAKTTVSFQLGALAGGTFGVTGTALGGSTLLTGVSNGSLIINGTAIPTDASTKSARALADAINAKSSTTGVTATAQPTASSASMFTGFGNIATGADGTYSLSVGGIEIVTQGNGVAAGSGITAASLDTTLAGPNAVSNALAAANITVTGTAAGGNLQFTRADGSNINIEEVVTGSTMGGIGHASNAANSGSNVTIASSITLASGNASPITIAGSNPAAAGLTAGSGGAYMNTGFTQDGTQATGSVVIDSTNNTLQGIRDAINNASLGVTASIVSDGSDKPYHLVLSSTKTGANSAMKITLSGSDGQPADSALSGLLAYDVAGAQNLKQNSAAQNTMFSVNGIAITSSSNSVDTAIEGVTLGITKIGTSSLSVAKDTTTVKTSITAFVKAYNDLNTAIGKMTAYNPDTKTGGVLLGDSTVQSIQTQLRRQLGVPITGLGSSMNTLSQVGISFQKDGNLTLDTSKLDKAISANFSDIAGLFSAIGKASDSNVAFTSSTAATKPGTYDLTITTMASQGSLTSDAAIPASTTIASDTTWNVTVNDTEPSAAKNTAKVTIPAGTYTPTQLASLVQSSINGIKAFSDNGTTVSAAIDGTGKLVLSSSRYGSVSNLAVSSDTGTGIGTLFGTAKPVKGSDVAGTLGGQPVVGSGQTLTGAPGSPAEGLKIEVTGGVIGSRGTVSFSQGYAYQLNNLATSFLGTDGMITGRTNGINETLKSVAAQRDKFSAKLTEIEARYRAQYTRLDVTLSKLQSTQTYLTQQLASIAANR
ncbi:MULTISPECIES: flagellar filament capping protein FliD [unclassified Janthinobacterium]|uniref:flagellar filament capping protein FliD n=1 Tax=unclassified Janthinobacterium TaxID=2610881 RepID=UPI000892CDCD|nr:MULTISPECIES: flagellar filament capping protein FliD [unclassified Janthinobacterium]OEZ91049.1 flagellar hook-associated protein 2 [Janthinobacterium sp. HH106]